MHTLAIQNWQTPKTFKISTRQDTSITPQQANKKSEYVKVK